jgi:hypothetical protein
MMNGFRLVISAQVAAAILLVATPVRSQQAPYYVSPSGNDKNPGTESLPFRTLTKARGTVRTVNKSMAQDIVVYLRGGTYPIGQTLLFDETDSGNNGHNIIYKSYPGEKAAICGGRKIIAWEQDSGNVWKARTDNYYGLGVDFRQLYVNGVRAARTRGGPLPNVELDEARGYKTSDVNMAAWGNQSDIELVYERQWDHTICKVDHISKEGSRAVLTMLQPYFSLGRLKGGIRLNFPAYIENARELLNAPGQWYLDRPAHMVYYIPRPGEDMDSAEVMAPGVEKLMELRGTLDAPVHNIQFEGITFCHASWLRPSQIGFIDYTEDFVIDPYHLEVFFIGGGSGVRPIHNECSKSPSNIVLHAAKSIRFERCTFTKFGSGGIDLEYGSQDNIISGSKFYDISGTAIQVGDVVDHHPSDLREVMKNNQIVNNYIHDVAVQYTSGVGIFAGYTDGTVIAHNEIRNLPYTGISGGWGFGEEDAGGGPPGYYQPFFYQEPTVSRNFRCEYNHVHNVMMQRNDGGAIYMLGNVPGALIRGNLVHDNVNNPGGIYLDDGAGFIEVTGNVVYNVFNVLNYNNHAQNRIATCHEHDDYFGVPPTDRAFPKAAKEVMDKAGLEPSYRDLLRPDELGKEAGK